MKSVIARCPAGRTDDVARMLGEGGVAVYNPKIPVKITRRVKGKLKRVWVKRPMFPCYFFVHEDRAFDALSVKRRLGLPFSLLRSASGLVTVDGDELLAVRAMCQEKIDELHSRITKTDPLGTVAYSEDKVMVGDCVVITSGVLASTEGVVLSAKDDVYTVQLKGWTKEVRMGADMLATAS